MGQANNCEVAALQMSAEEVATELERKIHDKNWLGRAGIAARHLVEELFDRDKLANQLMQVLEAAKQGSPELAARIALGDYGV